MLCNEGHRQALKARKERDKTRHRLLNIQFFACNFYRIKYLEIIQI
jgi:hypothetical protein